MSLFCISFSQLGIQLTYKLIYFHESCHSFEPFKIMHCLQSYCVSLWSSHAAKSLVMPLDVQRKKEFYPCSQKNLCVSTLRQSYGYFIYNIPEFGSKVLCHRCGIHHGPPSTRLFLLTSTHHLGNSLRNKFSILRSIYLSDIFSHFQHRFTSLSLDQNIPLGVRHQNIYSHLVDCTRVPWESLTSMVIPLTLVNDSHH